jgi:hypothetical protein
MCTGVVLADAVLDKWMFMERCSAEDGVAAADGAEGAVLIGRQER